MPTACLDLKPVMTVRELISALEPVIGRRLMLSTVHRWLTVGVGGTKLESTVVGGRAYITREAAEKFLAARNGNGVAS